MRNTYLTVGIIVVILTIVAFAIVRTRLPKIGGSKTEPSPTSMVESTTDSNKDEISVSKHTPAKTAVIDSVTLSKPGFVAIHENQNGQPGAILGVSGLLPAGKHENSTIELSRKTAPGENLFAMVHADNGDGKFEFPGPDEPAKKEDNTIVQMQLQVVAQGQDNGFQTPATGLGEE